MTSKWISLLLCKPCINFYAGFMQTLYCREEIMYSLLTTFFFEHTGELVASYNLWKRFLCGFLLGKKLMGSVSRSFKKISAVNSDFRVTTRLLKSLQLQTSNMKAWNIISLLQKLNIVTYMNFYTPNMVQADTNSTVSFVQMCRTAPPKREY